MVFKINKELKEYSTLISVIVPVYNEEETISEVISMLISLKKRMSIEILIVDDGSKDNTSSIIKQHSGIIFIKHKNNQGKGAAIKTGLNKCSGEIIIIQDADLEYLPNQIPKIVKPIIDGKADVVYGSRFLGKIDGMSLLHMLGNRILSFVAQILYGKKITDVMTGYKVFSKKCLDSIQICEKSFEVEVELTSKIFKNGFRFSEVPISYEYRRKGVSKINNRHGFRSLIKLFIYRFR